MSEIHEVATPLPGVFYRKPAPDKPPYAEAGDAVEQGQVIGLVEIMKQFSEIRAEHAGTIVEFGVEDAAMVNPGTVVARIRA